MDNEKYAESAPNRAPDPALKRLSRLVGVWDLTGRTLDAQEDNIRGRTAIAWLPGRYFLELRGEIEFMGETVQSLEIVGYDPETNTFPATVYSNMDGAPARYWWDVQGDVVTHWTEGSKYTGSSATRARRFPAVGDQKRDGKDRRTSPTTRR